MLAESPVKGGISRYRWRKDANTCVQIAAPLRGRCLQPLMPSGHVLGRTRIAILCLGIVFETSGMDRPLDTVHEAKLWTPSLAAGSSWDIDNFLQKTYEGLDYLYHQEISQISGISRQTTSNLNAAWTRFLSDPKISNDLIQRLSEASFMKSDWNNDKVEMFASAKHQHQDQMTSVTVTYGVRPSTPRTRDLFRLDLWLHGSDRTRSCTAHAQVQARDAEVMRPSGGRQRTHHFVSYILEGMCSDVKYGLLMPSIIPEDLNQLLTSYPKSITDDLERLLAERGLTDKGVFYCDSRRLSCEAENGELVKFLKDFEVSDRLLEHESLGNISRVASFTLVGRKLDKRRGKKVESWCIECWPSATYYESLRERSARETEEEAGDEAAGEENADATSSAQVIPDSITEWYMEDAPGWDEKGDEKAE